jgi:hypothetical protein
MSSVLKGTMSPPRFIKATVAAAIVGLAAITLYLVVERSVAERLPMGTCLLQLLQWDASNAYGPAAFGGGWPVAFVGLGMDFVVSLCWAAVFAVLYDASPFVRQNVVLAGLIFGAIVMVTMIYGVVPLGHATPMRSTASHVLNVLVAHTIFFGVPLGLTVSTFLREVALRPVRPRRTA